MLRTIVELVHPKQPCSSHFLLKNFIITSQDLLNKVSADTATYTSDPLTHDPKISKIPRFSETGFLRANTLPDTIFPHLSISSQASLGLNTHRKECEN